MLGYLASSAVCIGRLAIKRDTVWRASKRCASDMRDTTSAEDSACILRIPCDLGGEQHLGTNSINWHIPSFFGRRRQLKPCVRGPSALSGVRVDKMVALLSWRLLTGRLLKYSHLPHGEDHDLFYSFTSRTCPILHEISCQLNNPHLRHLRYWPRLKSLLPANASLTTAPGSLRFERSNDPGPLKSGVHLSCPWWSVIHSARLELVSWPGTSGLRW